MVSPFGFLPLQLDEPYPTRSEKLDARARRQAYPLIPRWWDNYYVPKHQCLVCGDLLDSVFEDHDCHKKFIPDMIQDDIRLVFDDSDSPAVGIDAISEHYKDLGGNARFISEQCYEGWKITYPEPQYPTVLKPRTKYRWGIGSKRAGSFQIDISNFEELEQGKPSYTLSIAQNWNNCLPEKATGSQKLVYEITGEKVYAPTKSLDGQVNWQRPEWLAKRLKVDDIEACQKLIDIWKSMDVTYDMIQGGFYNFIDRIRKNDTIYSAIAYFSKWSIALDNVTVEWDNKISTDRPIEELCEEPKKWYIDHLPNKYTNMDTEETEKELEMEEEAKKHKTSAINKYTVKGLSAQDEAIDWISIQPKWYKALYQRVSRMNTPDEIHTSGTMVFFSQQLYKVETLEDLAELQKQFRKNSRLKNLLERLTDLNAVKDVLDDTFKKWIKPMSYIQSQVFWNEHKNRKLRVEHGTSATFNWLVKQITKHPNRKALSELKRSGKYQLLNHQWTKLFKLTEQINDPYYSTI
jgi:hypothetical protein